MWIFSWHYNFERISWSRIYQTWRWWKIWILSLWIEQYWHYGLSNIDNLYSHLRRIQRDFDWCFWWFNKTFLYHKAKTYQSWYKTKSKATTGVKNTACYTTWLYSTLDQMVASNIIHFVLFLMTTTITQAFCIMLNQCLFIILKLVTHI